MVDLSFLEFQTSELSFENLIEEGQLMFLKKKIKLNRNHSLRNNDLFDFFEFYKISFNNYSFLHHSFVKCEMMFNREIPAAEGSEGQDPQIVSVSENVIAFVDIFGYLVIVADEQIESGFINYINTCLKFFMDVRKVKLNYLVN